MIPICNFIHGYKIPFPFSSDHVIYLMMSACDIVIHLKKKKITSFNLSVKSGEK